MPSAAEGRGSTRGPLRTLWASQLGPRRPVACRPREQAERRRLLRRRRRYGGFGGRKRGAEGAAHDGEGVGAHGRTRGSSGRRERGGGKLGQPAMATSVRSLERGERVDRERGQGVSEGQRSSGARLRRSRSATVAGHAAAARGHGGARALHGCHALSLWGISQSTWQATTWPH